MACVREGVAFLEYCDGSSYVFRSQIFCGPADGSSAGATWATPPVRRARRTRRPLLRLRLHWCSPLYFELLVVGRWYVSKLDWGPDLAQDGRAEMRPTILGGSSTLDVNVFRLQFSACKMIAAWCAVASMRRRPCSCTKDLCRVL
jgi:hypothetical protein